MTLEEFNSKYEYTSDGRLDNWQVMELVDGKYVGDCEDYALTVKAKVEGFQDLELYHCKYNGVGHCVGKLGDEWIDCILQREVETLPPLYTNVRKYWLIEIWCKRLYGRMFKWVNKYLTK